MISYIRFFVYIAFLGVMIALGINNQQLRANVDILKSNCENYQRMVEIKDVMLATAERNYHTMEKLSKEREEELETMEGKLREATALLEVVHDETVMPDSAYNVLRSLGIVRQDGNEGGICDGVQGDVTTGTMDNASGSTGNEREEVQRPSQMDY